MRQLFNFDAWVESLYKVSLAFTGLLLVLTIVIAVESLIARALGLV